MNAWEGLNRRRFPRVNYPCLVKVKQKEDSPGIYLTHTENIGVGGVGIILKKHIKLYAPVEVEIDLLDLDNPVKCHGKVVWSVLRKNGALKKVAFYDLGVEFINLPSQDLSRIEGIVKRLARHDYRVPYV
ncbi:MAG: PilZ domain-containing protein [Candidatus Omnitrophica bacterium]|nr:PilZ domain-containing protein [Candidatus Omnitrophota bacterium]